MNISFSAEELEWYFGTPPFFVNVFFIPHFIGKYSWKLRFSDFLGGVEKKGGGKIVFHFSALRLTLCNRNIRVKINSLNLIFKLRNLNSTNNFHFRAMIMIREKSVLERELILVSSLIKIQLAYCLYQFQYQLLFIRASTSSTVNCTMKHNIFLKFKRNIFFKHSNLVITIVIT